MKNGNTNSNNHLSWVDLAKGIGVILVVLGHLIYHHTSLTPIAKAIYSFHMPMFFIMSGYVMKKDELSLFRYINRKLFRLIVPTILLSAVLQTVYIGIHGLDNLGSFISGLFFIEGYIYFNYPAWFFIVLFEALIISKLINLINKSIALKLVWCIFFFLCGFFASEFKLVPWFGLDRTLLALGYITIGLIARKIHVKLSKVLSCALCMLIFYLWYYFAVQSNSLCSMYGSEYGNFSHFLIASLLGSFLFLKLCYYLNKVSFMEYLSQHSVFIVGSHYIFIWIFNDYISKFIDSRFIVLSVFLYFVVILIIYKMLSNIIEKHLFLLDGRSLKM